MRCSLIVAIFISLNACCLDAATVAYSNQGQWQTAVQAVNSDAPTSVSFATSDWNSTFQASASLDSRTSQSSNAASNGMVVTAISGYSPLGFANNAQLGQAMNGYWVDTISKYGSTQFNFSDAIYGFGGIFNISGSNGLEFLFGGGNSLSSPNGMYNGFFGFVSDQSFNSVTVTWGQNGCSQCSGNSYTLTGFEVANSVVQTPEPSYAPALAVLLLLGAWICLRRTA